MSIEEADTGAVPAEDDVAMVGAGGALLSNPVAELTLLGRLLTDPETFGAIEEHVFEADFSDPIGRRIFARLSEAARDGYSVGMKSIAEALGGPDALMMGGQTVSKFIAGLVANADPSADLVALAMDIHDCADRRANETEADIREFEHGFTSTMGLKMWVDQNDPGPQYDYLIEDLIPEKQAVVMMGETQTGKSFVTFDMAMCGARAVPFFGRRILEPFGVVWCAYEAGQGAPARMRAYRRFHDMPLEDLPFAALTRPLKLWPDPEDKHVDALITEIRAIAQTKFRGVKLGMVVIDTHNAGTPGASEIDSEVISRIRDRYYKIIEATGATLVIVGHTNSQGKHRGNEQLTNNVDTIIKVSFKTLTQNREIIQLKDDDGRAIRSLRVVKQREGRNGDEHDFVLREVEDGTKNRFGKARTSCVVLKPNIADVGSDDQPKDRDKKNGAGAKISRGEALFLQCLLDATSDAGVPPPRELGLPRSIGNVVDYDLVKRMIANKMLREDDNTPEGKKRHRERVKTAVKRAREGLMHIKVVGCHDPYIWWTGKPVRGIAATQPKERDLLRDEHPNAPLSAPGEDDPFEGLIG